MASWAELNKQAGSKQPQQASSWGSLNESAKASQPMRVSAPTPTQPVAAPVVAPKQTFKTVATDVATTFGQSLYNQGASAVESWKDAYNVFTNPRQEDTITKKWVDDYMGVQGKPESVKMVADVIGKEAKQAASNTTSAFGAMLKAGIKTMALAPSISVGNAGVEATAKIPYVGLPVKVAQQALGVLNEKIYNGVVSAVNAAPISDQAKKDLADPLAELATFIGSVAIMKKGGDLTGAVAQRGAKTFGASPATQAKVGTAVNVGIGYSVDPFMTAFELLRGNITSRAQARAQATGRALNAEDARRVVNEAVKETPVPDMPASTMEVATPNGKVNIVTNQKLVLQNLIKGREDLSYRVVDDLGTDPVTGEPINSRFDWDYDTQTGTITTTNKATAVDLAHELGYFVDRRVGSTLSKALSDIVPEYRDNRDQINQLLADYALDRLDGNASKADIDAEVLKIAQNITQEVQSISALKKRETAAQQFAGAFGDVINDPNTRSQSPELAQIIDYSLGKVARPSRDGIVGDQGTPQETSSILNTLSKEKNARIRDVRNNNKEFAIEQVSRIDRLQALEDRGNAISVFTDWKNISQAIRNSAEFKKEGNITDATINGTVMSKNGRRKLVPRDRVEAEAARGWVAEMTMDEVANAAGFESAEDYVTLVNELYEETRAITRSSEQRAAHEFLMKNDPEYAKLEETITALRKELVAEAERVSSRSEAPRGDAEATPREKIVTAEDYVNQKKDKFRTAKKTAEDYVNDRSLVAVHNTTADKLLFSEKTGGMANPSLGIIDINKGALQGYGDITLIGSKDLIEQGKTYASDVYSPRYPQSEYVATRDQWRNINDELSKYNSSVKEDSSYIEFDRLKNTTEGSPQMMFKFLKEKGINLDLSSNERVIYKLRDEISNNALQAEYSQYVDKFLEDNGAELSFVSGYTSSGNKKFTPATAENASKIMNRQGVRGGEGGMSFYGVGNVRAFLSKKLSSIEKIRKEKGKIISSEEFSLLKDSLNDEFLQIAQDTNISVDALLDYLSGTDKGWLKKEANPSQDLLNNLDAFKDKLKNAETEYFETKFNRVVGLGEFNTAIVPKNTNKNIIKMLEDKGIDVRVYDGTETGRASAIKEIRDKVAFRIKDDLADRGIDITDQQEAEIIALNKEFFGDADVKIIGQILVNNQALGKYQNGIIEILSGQGDIKDTFYHEAVHKYLDVFTDKNEFIEILNEGQKKYGIDDFAEIEERIAEDFIQYAKSRSGITGRLKQIFDEVIARITSFSIDKSKIDSLYKDIVKGKAKNKGNQTKQASSSQLVQPELKAKKSRVYERLQEELGTDLLSEDVEYTPTTLKSEADKAVDLIAKDRQKAYKIAMGLEKSDDVVSTSVNIALADAALEAGNNALFAQLTKARSLALTRAGKEIVAEKASISDNSTSHYVKSLIADRIAALGKSYLGDARQLVGIKDSPQARIEQKIDGDIKKAQKDVKASVAKKFDISKAQSLIDSLSC